MMKRWNGLIEEYKEWLPVTENTPALTLQEGNTPLIHMTNLSEQWGINLYVKTEGTNPTGSFKDRGMVMAVAKAKEEGKKVLICASTGNTSASAAAYGARAGMRTIVVIPEGRIALGKLAQAKMYGAEIVEIEGNFDEALDMVRAAGEGDVALVNSVNPYRLKDKRQLRLKRLSNLEKYQIFLHFRLGMRVIFLQLGKGSRNMLIKRELSLPVLLGVQADGAAPIVYNRVFENPETVATAIRIGNPASWELANNALTESEGTILAVTDEEILEAYSLIASSEGVFAEPGSCASIAGVKKQVESGLLKKGSTVVAVLTGNGLKDPDTAIEVNKEKPMMSREQFDAILSGLKAGTK